MSEEVVRKNALFLAHFTGWSLKEILDMEDIDFIRWVELLPKEMS